MKVVFLGMNASYSVLPLLAIREKFDVAAVYEHREPASGRVKLRNLIKKIIGYRSAGAFSLEKTARVYGLEFRFGHEIDTPRFMSWMKDLAPDLICVAGFSKKIPPGILQIPVMGVLNIHSGPLPAFRGAHPFYYLVKDSRAPGGVTIHWMNEKLDDGNIIQFIPVKLLQGMNLATYNELCAYHAAMVLPDLLTEMESGNRPAGTSNNGANAMNCRNPGLTLLDETIPVEVALWLFNAYSDVLIFEAVLKSGNMKITKLSKSEFQDSTPLHLKDGVVYIQ